MTTAPSSPPDPPSLGRLVELALTVPMEVGVRLIESAPAVVDKIPSAAERVRREIVLARFVGKLAVEQGVRELRSRLVSDPAATEPRAGATLTPSTGADADSSVVADVDAPAASSLALADYDHLSSAQVVAMLDRLDEDERAAIERYERAGRHRRTILGKLEQLRSEPAS